MKTITEEQRQQIIAVRALAIFTADGDKTYTEAVKMSEAELQKEGEARESR